MPFLDPDRYELPEIVLITLAVLRSAAVQIPGLKDPETVVRQIGAQILKYWGGIQTYVCPVNSKVSPRVCDEIQIWAQECLLAVGLEEEEAALGAVAITGAFRSYFSGTVIYFPRDRWTYRHEVAQAYNSHNMVELCRRYNLTSHYLYQIVVEERGVGRIKAS